MALCMHIESNIAVFGIPSKALCLVHGFYQHTHLFSKKK
jgi:hypothetical protein